MCHDAATEMQQLYIVRIYLLVLARQSKSEHIKLDSESEIKAGSAVLWYELFAATVAPSLDYYCEKLNCDAAVFTTIIIIIYLPSSCH